MLKTVCFFRNHNAHILAVFLKNLAKICDKSIECLEKITGETSQNPVTMYHPGNSLYSNFFRILIHGKRINIHSC